jgi:D-alanyl-D-alanine carboxypeptidase/D-alanyl-D-alanine-endopeptidase (penicillin-binding protein 4)
MKYRLLLILPLIIFLFSCSPSRQIAKSAKQNVLNNDALQTAHVGISIYEPASGKYWYNYQGDKYFVPASNTKLPTCYAAMKYLGDSLVGLRYGVPEEKWFKEHALIFEPTGDPTFLHVDYKKQPVFDFLTQALLIEKRHPAIFLKPDDETEKWGNGWSWNDYDADYMAERSKLPIFGNVIHISLKDSADRFIDDPFVPGQKKPWPFFTGVHYFDSLINKRVMPGSDELKKSNPKLKITREIGANDFLVEAGNATFKRMDMPFVTNNLETASEILSDTFKKPFRDIVTTTKEKDKYAYLCEDCDIGFVHINKWISIHSQLTDSLLKPMMHRSDNFFAEQSLLMVSNELLGVMNDAKVIDTLLKTDFKNLPQKPRWVDGSGLSRYNLFTPQDFVFILNKMKTDFGMDRIKNILPTGNEGTLEGRFVADSNFIFAKTGTLSGVVALSGFLYTKKNKFLIFSVLVNNHNASATQVRKAAEKFIQGIRDKY